MSSLDYQAHAPPQIFRNTQFCSQEDSFWTFSVDEPFLLSQHLSKLGLFVDSKMFVLILESWPWPGLLNTNELSLIFWDPWYVVVNNILKMPAIQNLTSSSLLWFSSFFWHSWPSSTKKCAPVSKQIHISLLAFSGLRNQAFVSFCRVRLLVCTATLQQDLKGLGFLHCSNTPLSNSPEFVHRREAE